MWRVAVSAFSAGFLTPLAIIEWKYTNSLKEEVANIILEDSLDFVDFRIKDSTRRIIWWRQAGPRIQLFEPVPRRFTEKV